MFPMELGVNRKGNPPHFSPAQANKISHNHQATLPKKTSLNRRKRKNFSFKNQASKIGKRKFSQDNNAKQNLQLKRNLSAKKSTNFKSKNKSKNQHHRRQKPLQKLFWLTIYALTIIVATSTILGTAIAITKSLNITSPESNSANLTAPENAQNKAELEKLFKVSSLGKEINLLKVELEKLAEQYPQLEPEMFLVDLDTKGFVSLQGNKAIASASTIKLPILVAFFQDLDRGKIHLEEQLTLTKEIIGSGSGNMQYQEPGTKFSALEVADKMITISDNTATNMLIQRLGGQEALNQRFMDMGLTATRLQNPLPDLEGTNTTSPEDLGNLLVKINSGELISLRSRDRLLHIMKNVVRDTLLPQGLESGAIIAHKTGDIKSVLGDAGIIDMPNGKRYIASVLVKRPDNDPQAKEFIQKASQTAYQYFKKRPQTSSFSLDKDD